MRGVKGIVLSSLLAGMVGAHAERPSPVVEQNTPPWFLKTKELATQTFLEDRFGAPLELYQPTVVMGEALERRFATPVATPPLHHPGTEQPFNTWFFGYNTIREQYLSEVTYTTLTPEGTWTREKVERGEPFFFEAPVVGQYCGYIQRTGVMPLRVPLNTAPVTDDTILYEGKNVTPVYVFEHRGDYFAHFPSAVKGLLCYAVAAIQQRDIPRETTVPFSILYPGDLSTILQNTPQAGVPLTLADELANYFVYDLSEETKQLYTSFNGKQDPLIACTQATSSDILCIRLEDPNLPTVALTYKKGDCDVHNTAAAAILRDRFGYATAVAVGSKCGNPERCEIASGPPHGWANIVNEHGLLIPFDATGKWPKSN